jgi:aryl-alcohol dehydrogenase-like predicted oxidoreductase
MTIPRRSVLGVMAASAAGLAGGSVATASATQPAASAPQAVIRRRIPRTGELVPAIGMGTWSTFDADPAGDLSRLVEVMRVFLAAGGSLIDSSPMYGRSEEVVGKVLTALGRTDLVYATKVWTDKGRDAGIEQMRASMRLMGPPVMDLMQIHNLVGWETHLPTLRQWKSAGTIRYLGVTAMRDFDLVERLMREEQVDFIQVPYSVGDRRVEDRILPAATETGTAVLVMRPFGGGDLFKRVRERPLPAWAAQIDCSSWAQFFLKFLLGHPAVTCPIPATANPRHMADNMAGGVGRLPDAPMRERMAAELAG